MAGKPVPRAVEVDGYPMVAVTAREYEGLIAARRQLGAQVARLRTTKSALVDILELAEALGAALADRMLPGEAPGADAAEPDASELLGEAHRRIDRARRITGVGGADAPRTAARPDGRR
ncbi:hypothetical protein ACFWP3_12410 [Streptomyces sp. NPDC058525]|uniref:hypothetical protein n=1 Tax=unclassified Streptomyces TaxID=2593676 RepID=UPI00365CF708